MIPVDRELRDKAGEIEKNTFCTQNLVTTTMLADEQILLK